MRNLHRRFDRYYMGQEISQKFVAFSEYMNFRNTVYSLKKLLKLLGLSLQDRFSEACKALFIILGGTLTLPVICNFHLHLGR